MIRTKTAPGTERSEASATLTGTGTVNVTVSSDLEPGPVTIGLTIVDAVGNTASKEFTFTVDPPDASFAESITVVDRGDVAQISINLVNTDGVTGTIGSEAVNFVLPFSATDVDGDGQVTVLFNTYLSDRSANSNTITAAGADSAAGTPERTPSDPVVADDYPLSVTPNGTDAESDVGTLIVQSRSAGTASTMVAPGSIDPTTASLETIQSASTPGHEVTYGDVAIAEFSDVSGLEGFFSENDVNDIEGFNLTISQVDAGPNATEMRFDADAAIGSNVTVFDDLVNDSFYVLWTPPNASTNDPGDWNVTYSLDGAFNNVTPDTGEGPEESATATFALTSNWVELNGGYDWIADIRESQTLEGETTFAPGTSFTLTARAVGNNPFLKTASAVVENDRTFSGTFDFSDVPNGTEFSTEVQGHDSSMIDGQVIDGSNLAVDVDLTSQPNAMQTAGEPISGSPTVAVSDQNGDSVSGVEVTATATGGAGSIAAGQTAVTTDGNGTAVFDDLVITQADETYHLSFAIDAAQSLVLADDAVKTDAFSVESAQAEAISSIEAPEPDDGNHTVISVGATDGYGNPAAEQTTQAVEVESNFDGIVATLESLTLDEYGQGTIEISSEELRTDGTHTLTVRGKNLTSGTTHLTVGTTGIDWQDSSASDDDEEQTERFTDPETIHREFDILEGLSPSLAERTAGTVTDTGTTYEFSRETRVPSLTSTGRTTETAGIVLFDTRGSGLGQLDPPGTLISAADVHVPERLEAENATLEYLVSTDRLEAAGAAPENLVLFRHSGGEWQRLSTRITGTTGERIHLEASTPGFSILAAVATSDPEPVMTQVPATVSAGETFTLDGGPSTNAHGAITEYSWSLDGQRLAGETTETSIASPGQYEVTLTVKNDAGETATASATLTVSEPAAQANADQQSGDDSAVPGFGVVVAVIALIVSAGLAVRPKN
ncbi:MAG: BGTF surface domain-containing protein [Natrialbaceae archaeon]|nr:BGTF surface domain-containing protein [Natrialbaceae archaeon]